MLMNFLRAIAVCFCGVSCAAAAIYTELPPTGGDRLPTEAVDYAVSTTERGTIISIDIGGIFSFGDFGTIPPNETRDIDVGAMLGTPGQGYRVIGLGWDVELDAYQPSWLSDAAIAFGDDPTYVDESLILIPGTGSDFPGLMQFQSNGIVDLTNLPGLGDVAFPLTAGILNLQFFETYNDYGGIPDAQWQFGSSLSIQVVPESSGLIAGISALAAAGAAARRRPGTPARTCG